MHDVIHQFSRNIFLNVLFTAATSASPVSVSPVTARDVAATGFSNKENAFEAS